MSERRQPLPNPKLKERGNKRTLICLSSAPVAKYLPSGLKQTLLIYKSPDFPAESSAKTLKVCEKKEKRIVFSKHWNVMGKEDNNMTEKGTVCQNIK